MIFVFYYDIGCLYIKMLSLSASFFIQKHKKGLNLWSLKVITITETKLNSIYFNVSSTEKNRER